MHSKRFLVFLLACFLLSSVHFTQAQTPPPHWAFPLPGFVGRTDPQVSADYVKWDPFATGHLATSCFLVADESIENWAKLEYPGMNRYAWYEREALSVSPNERACISMLDIYNDMMRSGANAVTGRMTVNVRAEPNESAALLGVLRVGEAAQLTAVIPDESSQALIPWLEVTLKDGTHGFIRSDLVLYVKDATDCVPYLEPTGQIRLVILDGEVELPFNTDILPALAEFMNNTIPESPPINLPRMLYFSHGHSELYRIFPGAWTEVLGVFTYARWDGCHVQSRHTGLGDLMAAAVVDASLEPLDVWRLTVHELAHLFGSGHEGFLNTYDWERLITLAVTNTCADAGFDYFIDLCTDLEEIVSSSP